MIIKLLFLFLTISIFSCKAQQTGNQNNDYLFIQGSWMPEGSPSIKLLFEGNTLKVYNNNILDKTYNWEFSQDTPFCGEIVPVGDNLKYIKYTDVNSGRIFCYEITSLSSQILQLRPLNKGGFLSYTKL